MSDLADRVAVVTGGATGLGRAIVLRYVRAGARVVIADVRRDEGEALERHVRDLGGAARFVRTDVTRGADVAAAVDEAVRHFGGLHVMTANAGIVGRSHRKSIVDVPDDDVELVMRVNFFGVWNSVRHAVPALRASGGGSITITSSTAAHEPMAAVPAYSASKAAVLGLVRSVAADLWPDIRVNAVSPGSMATDLAAHTAELMGVDAVAVTAPAGNPIPLVDPDVVARVHEFLASDLSVHVTGQAIVADGSRDTMPG